MPDNLTDRMGLNNKYAIEALNYLIQANKRRILCMFIYRIWTRSFIRRVRLRLKESKLDQRSIRIEFFRFAGKALNEAIFVIAGDSGMTQLLPANQRSVIDMPAMLRGISVLKPGEEVRAETEVALAVNETMAYVYNFKPSRSCEAWRKS